MLLRFASVLCVLLGFACNKKVAEAAAPTGPVVTIAYGESAEVVITGGLQINKTNAGFAFAEVVSDSRCPEGVDCIRAGEAVVRVVLNDGSERKVTVGAGDKNRVGFAILNGSVEVLDLLPYPKARVKTDPMSYRLKVKVVKASVQ